MQLSQTQKTLRMVLVAAAAVIGFAGAEAAKEAPLKGFAQLDLTRLSLPTLEFPQGVR